MEDRLTIGSNLLDPLTGAVLPYDMQRSSKLRLLFRRVCRSCLKAANDVVIFHVIRIEFKPKTLICFSDVFQTYFPRGCFHGYLYFQLLTFTACGNSLETLEIVRCALRVVFNLTVISKAN